MATEPSVALVRRYFEECVDRVNGPDGSHALATLDEILDADFVMSYNNESDAQAVRGRERHKEFIVEHAHSFPDDRWTVEALVADEDTVACHWRIEARHGTTGNPIDQRAADFFTVRNGRLAELRRFLDFDGFRRQLLPPEVPG